MRILIFEQRYTNPREAGIGRFFYFGDAWSRMGNEVTVIAGMVSYVAGKAHGRLKWRLFAEENENDRFRVIRVNDSTIGYRSFVGRLWSYFSYFFLAFFAGLSSLKPDVILASSPPIFIGLLGYLVALTKGVPFVFEIRDIWPDEAVELGFLKNKLLINLSRGLEMFLYRHSSHIVVNSPGIGDYLVDKKAVPGARISSVLNPVDIGLFRNLDGRNGTRKKLGWEDKTVFIYGGALSAVYDFDLLLDAAKEMNDPTVLFAIVGDGRQRAKMKERAEREKIKNVFFMDAVPKAELPALIQASDIGVAVLKDMGLLKYIYATKLFDYMAGGLPIVLAMDGVSRALVSEEAKSGLTVPPGDKESLKEALKKLAGNKKLRDNFGRAGKDFAAKNLDPQKLAEDYLEVLRKPAVVPER
ncbi:MAG: glycosyltransferase family 4 protein [Minisyncoccia bacterium]|jgi:glycosyltransferase involved in cell wall biosynthesis